MPGQCPQDLHLPHVVRHGMVWALVEGTQHGEQNPWAVPGDLRWVGIVPWSTGVHNLQTPPCPHWPGLDWEQVGAWVGGMGE